MKIVLYTLFLILAVTGRCQDNENLYLKWKSHDSSNILFFDDTNTVKSWGKIQLPFSEIKSYCFQFNSKRFYLLQVIGCSGISCSGFYFFESINQKWSLIKSATCSSLEIIDLKIERNEIWFFNRDEKIYEFKLENLLKQ